MARDFFGSDTPQQRASRSNQIWEARQRAREDVVDSFDTINDPQDVAIEHSGRGVGPADEFLEWAEPQEVAHDFDQEIPEYDVGTRDIMETADGWGFTPEGERRVVAAEFEADTPLREVDPQEDVQQRNGEFELTENALERAFGINPDFF